VKELVTNNLIQTTWLSIEKRGPESYELQFKGDINRYLVETLLQKNNLTLEENKEKGYFIIYKKQKP
jgi:hypothetical protein